jgi:2-oxoglutarate dehydrogenase E2 component (dihydrolipoamide succinyltransferase)
MSSLQVKMTRIRKKTAEHLKQSQNTAAFLTTFNEVDMSKLMDFRKMNKDSIMEQHGIKLGYMGALARASSLALKEIPAVNAAIENGDTIVYRDYVDLSIAAAIPKGLVTPVLRNIESMGLVEIEKNISSLVAKVNTPKVSCYLCLLTLRRPEMENSQWMI